MPCGRVGLTSYKLGVGRLFALSLMNSPQCKLAILPFLISGTNKQSCISEKECVSLRIREGDGGKGKYSLIFDETMVRPQ